MEQFDLTVLKIGLEKGVFQPNQIMRLIYGDLIYAKVPPDAFSLVWNVSNFNHLPIPVRKQLVQLLRESQSQKSPPSINEVDVYANNSASCALNSILHGIDSEDTSDNNLLAAVFSADTPPATGVKEIINWVIWGVELDEEVWEMARRTLNVFLKDAPLRATVYERVMAKKFELCTREKELKISINKALDKSIVAEDKMLELENESIDNFSQLLMMCIRHAALSREVEDLYCELCNVHLLMGQAETYNLVKRHYTV